MAHSAAQMPSETVNQAARKPANEFARANVAIGSLLLMRCSNNSAPANRAVRRRPPLARLPRDPRRTAPGLGECCRRTGGSRTRSWPRPARSSPPLRPVSLALLINWRMRKNIVARATHCQAAFTAGRGARCASPPARSGRARRPKRPPPHPPPHSAPFPAPADDTDHPNRSQCQWHQVEYQPVAAGDGAFTGQ